MYNMNYIYIVLNVYINNSFFFHFIHIKIHCYIILKLRSFYSYFIIIIIIVVVYLLYITLIVLFLK